MPKPSNGAPRRRAARRAACSCWDDVTSRATSSEPKSSAELCGVCGTGLNALGRGFAPLCTRAQKTRAIEPGLSLWSAQARFERRLATFQPLFQRRDVVRARAGRAKRSPRIEDSCGSSRSNPAERGRATSSGSTRTSERPQCFRTNCAALGSISTRDSRCRNPNGRRSSTLASARPSAV